MNPNRLWAAALLFAVAPVVHGFSAGTGTCFATDGAVAPMGGVTNGGGSGPFAIAANSTTYSPGQSITITLSGPVFNGLLMYASGSDVTSARRGTWTSLPSGYTGSPNSASCPPANSLVSHNNANARVGGTFTWTAPATDVGDVYIVAMFMTASRVYYLVHPNQGSPKLTFFQPNTPPTINASGVTRRAGDAGANATVATVADGQDASGTLTVTVNDGASATQNGVTVGGLAVSATGQVTANVAAACAASAATFVLRVTDSGSNSAQAQLAVAVDPNVAPSLAYPARTAVFGESLQVAPTVATDSGGITGFAPGNPGTYTGGLAVDAAGVASLAGAAPVGTHAIGVTATDNCGSPGTGSLALTVQKAVTTLTIDDTPDSSVNGTSVVVSSALTVVAPGAGVPTGDIVVTGTDTSGCTIPLPATQCSLGFTSRGAKTLQASFTGNASFATASSNTLTHTVTPGADLSLTNSNGQAAIVQGTQVDYLIEVRNDGPDGVAGALLDNNPPAALGNLGWFCSSVPPAACPAASGSGALDATIDLGVGQTLQFLLTGSVIGAPGTTAVNSISIAAPIGTTDLASANNSAVDSDPVVAENVFGNGFE